jgi:hypothetical protein
MHGHCADFAVVIKQIYRAGILMKADSRAD